MSASFFRSVGWVLVLMLASGAEAVAPPTATHLHTPLAFEVNRGQADAAVRYLARGPGYTMMLAPDAVVVRLQSPAEPVRRATVRMRFVDGNVDPALDGDAPLAARSHYLIGRDPAGWHTDIPLFAKVRYAGVYPGVDAVLYGNQRALEYDLVVAPGIDPAGIVLGFTGAERVALDADGALVLHAHGGDLIQRAPVAYQEVDGARRPVASRFVLLASVGDETRVGFALGAYDHTRPLVIDPVLAYATYLGGPNANDGRAIAVDTNGNAYVTGSTNSTTFPNVGGLPDPNDDLQDSQDAFVTKLDPDGALVYSTYLGGTGTDVGNGIAVDDLGSAYVAGETGSGDFPTVSPLASPNNALQGGSDGFVAKLAANGASLLYSTYLGGSASNERATGIAVDASRNAYVTGTEFSDDFPIAGALANNVNHGGTDAFVTKLATNGSSLVYSLHLGGSGFETGLAIAVRSGEAHVTGRTQSGDFPLVANLPAPNNGLRGFSDGYVTKVNAAGSALTYSTYLSGSSDEDDPNAIAVDTNGNAFIGGRTLSSNLLGTVPATGSLPAPNTSFRGGADGYVVKLAANGSLGFLAFVGGSSNSANEGINGIAVDPDGNVLVTGVTSSNDFPVVGGLPSNNRRGQNNDAAIVTQLAAAGNAILFSTYLGGTRQEVGRGIAVSGAGDAYVVGQTGSNDFPVKNAAQATHGSGDFNNDVFVAKISDGDAPSSAYTPGNVFVSVPDFGEVREYTPTGTLVRGLPVPSGGFTSGTSLGGIAFDDTGNLYVTDLVQNRIFRFDTGGIFAGTFATGINAAPQSLIFDGAGNLLVGTTAGSSDVLQYGPGGNLLQSFDVFVHDVGALWMDLGADQRTLAYTANFGDIATFDLVTETQGADIFIEDVDGYRDFGLRLLPNGHVLLAGQEHVVRRIDQNGDVVKTYTPNPAGALFQVSRDPDGTTLWSASSGTFGESGRVYAFDIASAAIVHQFAAAAVVDGQALGGLAVFGELSEARDGAPPSTPTPVPTRTPAPEVCDDCIDNDFDAAVDRNDSECPERADGGEQGLGDPKGTGKAIVKCGKALGKAGSKTASARQKALQKCLGAMFACVQQKPGDAKCTTKATAACGKGFAKLPAGQSALANGLLKKCGAPLTVDDLRSASGLGFATEESFCTARGVPNVSSTAEIVSCVLLEHACRAESLVGSQIPRARELLTLAGRQPDSEFPCLDARVGSGALGASAKAAVKCQQAIAKAGLKFASARLTSLQKCVAGVYTCIQVKPTDAKCRTKAGTTCTKQLAKLADPAKGAAAKLTAAIAKACTKSPLTLGDVVNPNGLAFDALSGECTALGGSPLTSIAAVSDCVRRRHQCRADQMLENELPRLRELLTIGGVALP